jgi:hypothetical protein
MLWYNMKPINFAKWNWELPQIDYRSPLSNLVEINSFLEMSNFKITRDFFKNLVETHGLLALGQFTIAK